MQSAPRQTIKALIVLGFVLCNPLGARAAPIEVSPISVSVTPPEHVAQITIRNPSEEPLRLQVSASAWSDASNGTIKMTPTQDIIVYPQLVTIPLFGKQEIRAAIVSPPGAIEKTYRIVLNVLPPLSDDSHYNGPGVHLSIRTRFTVPIFQEPLSPRISGQITTATAKRGTLQFTIANSGNAHLGGDEIRIIGRNEAGKVIFSEPFWGWYVLVSSTRSFSFHLPQAGCGDVRSLTIAPPPTINVPPKKIEAASGVCGE